MAYMLAASTVISVMEGSSPSTLVRHASDSSCLYQQTTLCSMVGSSFSPFCTKLCPRETLTLYEMS